MDEKIYQVWMRKGRHRYGTGVNKLEIAMICGRTRDERDQRGMNEGCTKNVFRMIYGRSSHKLGPKQGRRGYHREIVWDISPDIHAA